MNQYNFEGRTAVVTGGAQGIGYAVAEQLLAGGAKVSLWDVNGEALASARAALGTDRVHTAIVDIRSTEQIGAALAQAEGSVGPVAILVHSAGIAGAARSVADYDPAEWRNVVDINLNGSFNVNRAIVSGMLERDYGRIVNIASIAGKEGNPNAAAYSASKAGVIALTKSLGKETALRNVAVNCITPAAAKTRILEQVSQQHIDYMLSKIPRGRFVTVEEIAAMVSWLVSEDNSFTTGAVFDLSGGRATY